MLFGNSCENANSANETAIAGRMNKSRLRMSTSVASAAKLLRLYQPGELQRLPKREYRRYLKRTERDTSQTSPARINMDIRPRIAPASRAAVSDGHWNW